MMKNEAGRSMIEMLGVLAIIGVLSVGGIAGYSKAMKQIKVNKLIGTISSMANNVRTLYMTQKNYEGLTEDILFASGDLPQGINKSENKIIVKEQWTRGYYYESFFNNSIRIGEASNEGNGFFVELFPVSLDLCVPLLSYDWNSVGVQAIMFAEGWDVYMKTPIAMSDVAKVCSYWNDDLGMDFGWLAFYFDVDISTNEWQETLEDCSLATWGC